MSKVRSPELPKNATWLNTDRPLSIKELKGRIVILDFWTYCCINCLQVLPYLKYLEQKYKNILTVIGVHSAKFDNDKNIPQISKAILRYDIEHPVVVDNDFYIWEQYAVRAWPTLVIIDPQGYVIGQVSGEGHREALDDLINDMIQEHQEKGTINYQEIRLSLEKQRQPVSTPLRFPGKVLADEKRDRLLIADSGNHRIVITKLSGELIQIIGNGQRGLKDGLFADCQFCDPQGMALDETREILYVADPENHTIREINFKHKTVKTIAGTGQQNRHIHPARGLALETPLNSPWDLALIEDILLIAIAGSHQIWDMDLTSGIIGIYAGTGAEGCVDGDLETSAFAQPSGVTTDGEELFIADSEISSIRAIILDENAQVRTVCGSGALFGFGDRDGIGEQVLLQHCLGIDYARGYLWIADSYNHKIKRVNPQTGDCVTIVGDGTSGDRNGIGTDCQFSEPGGLSVGNTYIYVADTNNHRICSVDLETMMVKTFAISGLCPPNVCLLPYI